MFFKWTDVLEYLRILSSDSKRTEKKVEKNGRKADGNSNKKISPA